LVNANDGTQRVFSSRIGVQVIGGSARLCPSYDYHNDFASVRVSIEGRGSPPILASNPATAEISSTIVLHELTRY
jgi:hypothetical protein